MVTFSAEHFADAFGKLFNKVVRVNCSDMSSMGEGDECIEKDGFRCWNFLYSGVYYFTYIYLRISVYCEASLIGRLGVSGAEMSTVMEICSEITSLQGIIS